MGAFDDVFGGTRGRRSEPTGDLRSRLEISLSEAVYGTEKHIQVQGRSIRVKVPPGGQDGKRGALFLDVKIKPHPSFERQDLDLVTQVSVPIPTLSQDEVNSVELTIPPGTQPGNQLRVRGQGVVDRTGRCGDLRIKIKVE